ncbi:MAG TPA: gamma-glutamyltransferase, partial [Longimicrobiales bacterium]|nr:gamma-glutamyltransferase [Longimicrobiales bacterium]
VRGLSDFPASVAQFLPRGGQPPEIGDTLRQPDLAATLRRIRDRGRDGFYLGETADLIAAEMERGGGIITLEDLASYEVAWREPIVFGYREHTVISMPPSSSGGATMAEMAHILDRYDLTALGFHSPATIHLYAEAWRRAYADRNEYLADPDFVDVPLDRMTSPEYAAERAATISTSAATPSSAVAPGIEPARSESRNTTHFSILDARGNAVAITTTLNSLYGSKVTVAGAGFLLNNEMDDFSALPGSPNQFGLVQGEQNAVEPGKRMLSAMTPTIVLAPDGSVRIVTGSPGGSTIITTVFQTISNVLDFGMDVVQAVNAPRVHHQHLPDQIFYERSGLDAATVRALERLGHTVVERDGVSGDVQMILVEDTLLTAWSDPRRGGRAIGY